MTPRATIQHRRGMCRVTSKFKSRFFFPQSSFAPCKKQDVRNVRDSHGKSMFLVPSMGIILLILVLILFINQIIYCMPSHIGLVRQMCPFFECINKYLNTEYFKNEKKGVNF